MGFKLLKPLTNICVKTDFSTESSTSNDVFETEDLIKYPKTSPSIYTKERQDIINRSSSSSSESRNHPIHLQNHRHSIITLLQPPRSPSSSATVKKKISFQTQPELRRNSEQALLKPKSYSASPIRFNTCQNTSSSSFSLVSGRGKEPKPLQQQQQHSFPHQSLNQNRQCGLLIQKAKLCTSNIKRQEESGKSNTTSTSTSKIQKSRIPTRISTLHVNSGKTEKVSESKFYTSPCKLKCHITSTQGKSKIITQSKIPFRKLDEMKTTCKGLQNRQQNIKDFGLSNKLNFNHQSYNQHSLMTTSPDQTKLLLTSAPAITITTETPSDQSLEEESQLLKEDGLTSNNNANGGGESHGESFRNDLKEILGNFVSATSPVPSRRPSLKNQESFITDLGIIDTSKCIDFGIYDCLSENYLKTLHHNRDEIEIDMSSDTDTSYLGASPPHRFSDSDFEPLAITLETSFYTSSPSNPTTESHHQHHHRANKLFNFTSTTQQQTSNLIDDRETLLNNTTQMSNFKTTNFKKPLRRNISLPATIFKLRLIGIGKTISSYDNTSNSTTSTTATIATPPGFGTFGTRHSTSNNFRSRFLSRLDSTSLTEIEKSQQLHEHEHEGTADDDHVKYNELTTSLSNLSLLWSTTKSNSNHNHLSILGNDDDDDAGSLTRSTGSGIHDAEFEDVNDENESVFSDIEKRALDLRNVRQKMLQRQDTVGNFAPPDFCNT